MQNSELLNSSPNASSPNLRELILSPGLKSYEIGTKIAYRNGGRTAIPRSANMDCSMVAAAPVLPVGYIVSASRIGDRRIILAGYRWADLLTRILGN
jgi:hypothetical protein